MTRNARLAALAVYGIASSVLSSPAVADKGGGRRDEPVQPLFGLTKPEEGPFPSDRFTVVDATQNTCLRIDLPKPANCAGQNTCERVNMPMPADCVANGSTCIEMGWINQLDGFNTRPRIAIPFDGDIDLSTVDSTSIFIVSLGDAMIDGAPGCLAAPAVGEDDDEVVPRPDAGWVVGIDQAVWDPLTHTLYVEAGELLKQHTRYAVFVTRALKDTMGKPIETPKAFKKAIGDDEQDEAPVDPTIAAYEASLRRAVAQARFFGVKRHDIAVASVFTTLSVTAPIEKIRVATMATPAPEPAVFTIANGGARAVFDLSKITTITFNRQFNVTGPLSSNTSNNALPALQIVSPGRIPPGVIKSLAFFRIAVPNYVQEDATLVPFATYSGTPTQFGTADLYLELMLPSGTPPAAGWPVVIWGFGSSENGLSGSQWRVAADFAAHRIATLTWNPLGYGFGPKTTVAVAQTGKPTLTFPFPGRAVDLNHDGSYLSRDGGGEGHFGFKESRILFDRDANRQTIADLTQIIRAIEVGVDVDGDGTRDLDPARVYYGGLSMGSVEGILATVVEPRFKAAAFSSPAGFIEHHLVPSLRGAFVGAMLKEHVPSLLNPPGTPVITQLGGVAVTAPFYNENMPAPGQPPLVNTIAGALEIQEYFERLEWLNANNAAGAFMEFLKTKPINGRARPVLIQMARGDRTTVNPSVAYGVRAGMLEDRVTLYRHDLNPQRLVLLDPHTVIIRTDTAQLKETAFQAQDQFAAFFDSNGASTIDPDDAGTLFETPAVIPPGFGFIIP